LEKYLEGSAKEEDPELVDIPHETINLNRIE
jgi:hypothetical protein